MLLCSNIHCWTFCFLLIVVGACVSRLMDRLPLHEQSLSFCFIMSGFIDESSQNCRVCLWSDLAYKYSVKMHCIFLEQQCRFLIFIDLFSISCFYWTSTRLNLILYRGLRALDIKIAPCLKKFSFASLSIKEGCSK